MFKSRTVGAAIGLPIAVVIAFGGGCGWENADGTRPDGSAATPSAANGIDKLTPTKAFTRAMESTLSARSVRMRGQAKDNKAGLMKLDYRYSGRDRVQGTMQIGNQRVESIRIGKVVYQKGNKAYIRETSGQDAVSLLANKWMEVETGSGTGFGALSGVDDLDGMLKELATGGFEGWTMGKAPNVNGLPAVVMNGAGQQIHIASQGPPYVLRISLGDDLSDFLSYNAPVSIKKPPANLIVETEG